MTGSDPRHEVHDLKHAPGELSFEAQIGEHRERVWLRTDSGEPTSREAVLPACLMPAMRLGGSLKVPVAISPRVLRNQREFQAIQRAWSLRWPFGEPPLREVEVVADALPPQPPGGESGRVAAFFSGGVDSWSTVLDHPELTDLIFVRGLDLLLDAPQHAELTDQVEARLRAAAAELGREFHVVETNLREMSDPLVRWEAFYCSALAAVALFLAPRFERVLMANAHDYEVQEPLGVSRLVEHLWSTERLEVAEDGGRYSRVERLRRIASDPLVQRTLRVCWESRGGAYNCGRCRKCLTTMTMLEALGALAEVETLPSELEPEAIGAVEVRRISLLTRWEDVLDAVRAAGRSDLEPTVEGVVEGGKRALGLPPDHRRRASPGPPPLHRPRASAAASDGAPPTLESLLASRSWRLTAPLRRAGALLRRLQGWPAMRRRARS